MDQILQLELRLLMLRYSRRKILEGLAALGEQTLEAIEAELTAVHEATTRKKSKARPKPQLSEVITQECQGRPEIAKVVQLLATRFENRTFLPQLKDVQRFLDRFGAASRGRLKSRSTAVGKIIHVLAQMHLDELTRLAEPAPANDSDYAVLARQIMGRDSHGRPAQDKLDKAAKPPEKKSD